MRKLSLPITVFALGALLLSACSGATQAPASPTQGPGPELTGTVQTEATTAATSAATTAPTEAATAEATSAATTAPTTAATSAPTTGATSSPTAGAEATGTPAVGQPVNYVRLSDLFKLNVAAKDQTTGTLGTVDGFVLERPAVSGAAAGTSASANVLPAVINYLVVKTQGDAGSAARDVLVPWKAFVFEQAGSMAAENAVLTLDTLALNVNGDAFAGAPNFDRTNTSGMASSGWDANVTSYWAQQGLSIPATGAPAEGSRNEVFIDQQMLSTLKIKGPDGTELGSVSDFLINANTGEVTHAILTGGASLNNQSFVIPLSNLNWSGTTGVDLGNLVASFQSSIFTTAPALTGTTLPQDWFTLIQNFWNTVK